jgi:hypothetical protein
MTRFARPLLAAALLATAAAPANAGEGLGSYQGAGFVELFYASFENADDEGGIYGDFDIAFRPGGGALGFDLGAFAARSNEGGNGILYWAGTWYLPNGGKLSVGNPRSVYDLFERSVHNDAQGVLGNFVLRSQMQVEEFFDGGPQFGASYLGEAGAFRYGASLHGYELDGFDITALAVGGSFRWEDYLFSAAYENSDANRGGVDFQRFKVGVSADYGTFGFGTAYRVFGDGTDTERSWESHLFWEPTDRIRLTGTFQSFSGNPESVTGLAAKYNFTRNAYARAGAVFSNSGDAYSIGLGYEF